MSSATQWLLVLTFIIASSCRLVESKVFKRCELAKVLRQRHRLDLTEVAQWVCIAQHSSGFNTAAVASSPTGGSHGLFQISDVYWCSPPGQGAGCNLPCHKLRDDNLSDDLSCIKRIYDEHQRLSGDGYTAWNAYQQFCRHNAVSYIQDCFQGDLKGSVANLMPAKSYDSYQKQFHANSIQDYSTKGTSKVYGRCELARELYSKHKMPMQQIPTWVCIAEHESRFNTAAVGRLNADGSADHGLFQISDLYWCSHGSGDGKACGMSCKKLLDNDITDDVRCIKKIHSEHTAISGDGFTAWTVYKPHCQSQRYEQIENCFKNSLQTYQHNVLQSITNQKQTSNKFTINNHNPFYKHILPQSPAKTHYSSPSYNDVFKPHYSSAANSGISQKGKVYTRCSLAQELFFKHKFPIQDISTWVCIAEHESQFNTAALGRLRTDGSADHGLFQISDRYWCDHSSLGGKACKLPCGNLLDEDLTDDVACIKIIHEEHTRLSGDGFNAWTVYRPHCQNQNIEHIKKCFDGKTLSSIEQIEPSPNVKNVDITQGNGKMYTKCELAKELFHKHHMPMDQIPKWVCIAHHESSFNTTAVGRLNTDGSADYGLFQISDLYWCSNDQYGGKACNIPCHKFLDSDITDDIRCIKMIHEEHTRISGDGFNAWLVYQPHCHDIGMEYIKQCFTEQELSSKMPNLNSNSLIPQSSFGSKSVGKGKIYKKCELAQELYHKHHMPMEQIPKWVCIAQHESSYNTAAVGRLNSDGSADHGIFQVSDLYWCTHDQYGGKACNIPCDKLLDSDITDDVKCIRIIHEEHTRISGDGFNAWTVYKPHCRNTGIGHVQDCFTEEEFKEEQTTSISNSFVPQSSLSSKPASKGKIYKKCELAQELFHKHHMPMEQIPKWVCIAQHESSYNTAAVGRLNSDGSADHGLFQVSDLYWCTHDQYGGKACNIPCDKLLDSDITDDVKCIRIIHEEHTRISGDGFNAWTVYKPHCRNTGIGHVQDCFTEKEFKEEQTTSISNSFVPQSSLSSKPASKGKIYKKCELAQELFHKHHMPMEQIPKWVCIAQHESSYNTAAVGRLNSDGSADHGLFQVSDLYWCTHDQYGGKACNIPCDKLLDSDITDDVKCIRIIHEEHTRISGDGFNAWTVYKPHCHNTGMDHIQDCFTKKELKEVQTSFISNSLVPQSSFSSKPASKGKIYKKCELAQELFHKHHMPMEQIPKWVCIAQHESSYNTAAVGRLNVDGSADHGLFQISDLYWCTHDQYGGKACNIPCHNLLDSDITDDVECIKIIHEEHTRISGDGFNAWTVYKPHCRSRNMEEIRTCFSPNQIKELQKNQNTPNKVSKTQEVRSYSSYSHNPFLNKIKPQTSQIVQKTSSNTNLKLPYQSEQSNYAENPFLQNTSTGNTEVKRTVIQVPTILGNNEQQNYKQNPFLDRTLKPSSSNQNYKQWEATTKANYNENPFLNGAFSSSANNKFNSKPISKNDGIFTDQNKFSTTLKPTKSSASQNNPFFQHTLAYKKENNKNYLNSNDFRTTTTPKPQIAADKSPTAAWTTTTRKPTSTSARPTTTIKPLKKETATTKKLATTTTTKKPTTTTTKPTPTKTLKSSKNETTTPKKLAATTTTKRPATTTTKKSSTTTWTTKPPKTTATWSWQNQKSTTKQLKTTTARNWNNQKYQSSTTTKPQKTNTNTQHPKTTTRRSWHAQNYPSSTTPKSAKMTTTWQIHNQKYYSNTTFAQTATNWKTTKGQTTKSPVNTTAKPERTTWNWRNERKSSTTKPFTTTDNWRKWDKTTTKKAMTSTPTTTRKTTQKPTRSWLSTTTTTTKRTSARTTKAPTNTPIRLDNYKTSTSKPQTKPQYYNDNLKTTTLRPRTTTTVKSVSKKATVTTTTSKPLTTKSFISSDYNKYKNDPFSHPFFTKVNEELKQWRGNYTTTRRPSFAATKVQSFSESQQNKDFKNSTLNKTRIFNFDNSKLVTTKRPRL